MRREAKKHTREIVVDLTAGNLWETTRDEIIFKTIAFIAQKASAIRTVLNSTLKDCCL